MSSLEERNRESLKRQRETRERRDIIREEKDTLKSELQGVTSTRERRSIKADWLARGQAAEARRQKTKEIANNKDDNTGNRPIIDNGVDGVPRSSFEASSGGGNGGGGEPAYAFQVVDDGNGTVSVREGTVNTETATGLEPSGNPTELWLKATFNASDEVTAASIVTSAGSTSATEDYRQVASITWNGNTPTIIQGIKGSQSIASCGATHQWGTLYS